MTQSDRKSVESNLAADDYRGGKPSVCIDWYHEGESRTIDVAGVQITVRFIGRNGRRGRIAIEAPPGAVFRARESRS